MPPDTRWPELLDALEASIAGRDRAIYDGVTPPPVFAWPAGIAPVPPDLVERARGVLAALDDQEQRLGNELARLRTELRRLARLDGPATRIASGAPRHRRLDTRA